MTKFIIYSIMLVIVIFGFIFVMTNITQKSKYVITEQSKTIVTDSASVTRPIDSTITLSADSSNYRAIELAMLSVMEEYALNNRDSIMAADINVLQGTFLIHADTLLYYYIQPYSQGMVKLLTKGLNDDLNGLLLDSLKHKPHKSKHLLKGTYEG